MEPKKMEKNKKATSTCHLIDQCTVSAPHKLNCPITCYQGSKPNQRIFLWQGESPSLFLQEVYQKIPKWQAGKRLLTPFFFFTKKPLFLQLVPTLSLETYKQQQHRSEKEP